MTVFLFWLRLSRHQHQRLRRRILFSTEISCYTTLTPFTITTSLLVRAKKKYTVLFLSSIYQNILVSCFFCVFNVFIFSARHQKFCKSPSLEMRGFADIPFLGPRPGREPIRTHNLFFLITFFDLFCIQIDADDLDNV